MALFLKPEYWHISPLVGFAAKNTKLIYNLRFFGNYEPGYIGEIRSYSDDKGNDRMWKMVRILFPSTGGALTTTSAAAGNFALKIQDCEPVVRLLFMALDLRQIQKEIDAIDVDLKDVLRLAKEAPKTDQAAYYERAKQLNISKTVRYRPLKEIRDRAKAMHPENNEYEQLCEHVYELVTNPRGESEKDLDYPKCLLEQILIGFVMCHFSDGPAQYMSMLQIFDLERASNHESIFTDVAYEPHAAIWDHVGIMNHVHIRQYLTPYGIEINSIINNGNAKIFDRTNEKCLNRSFADCCETAIRHVCAILLWDYEAQKIRPSGNADIDRFFEQIAPNDGSIVARSQWNSVVGDLNKRGNARIAYGHEFEGAEYDLNGAMDNYALILMRLFNLETNANLKRLTLLKQRYDKSGMERFMEIIFNQIGPHDCRCVFTGDFTSYGYVGNLRVFAPGLEFDLYGNGHGEVNILTKEVGNEDEDESEDRADGEDDEDDDVDEVEEWLRGRVRYIELFKMKEFEMLPVTFQIFRSMRINIPQCDFYQKMSINLQDNFGIRRYLGSIKSEPTGHQIASFCRVLDAVSWDDAYFRKLISRKIWRLFDASLCLRLMHGKIKIIDILELDQVDHLERMGITKLGVWHIDANKKMYALRSFTFPRGITHTGDSFLHMYNLLQEVILPDGLICIGHAFLDGGICASIEGLEIPDSVTEIGCRFLSGHKRITSIKLPRSLKSVSSSFMKMCTSLEHIELPQTLTQIGDNFLFGTKIQSLTVPAAVEHIENDFLRYCEHLASVNLPSTIKSIGRSFMSKCSRLKELILTTQITLIDTDFLKGCVSLETVIIDSPVTKINACFLEGCTALTRVELPNTLVTINWSGFLERCSSIKTLVIPASVVQTEDFIMCGCLYLKDLTIPDIKISKSTFQHLERLETLRVPREHLEKFKRDASVVQHRSGQYNVTVKAIDA